MSSVVFRVDAGCADAGPAWNTAHAARIRMCLIDMGSMLALKG
jgi:hypothetical protein